MCTCASIAPRARRSKQILERSTQLHGRGSQHLLNKLVYTHWLLKDIKSFFFSAANEEM